MKASHKARVITGGNQQFRPQNFLFIIEFPAIEAVTAHVLEFFRTGLPLVEQPAPPVKVNAARGIAFLFLKNMVCRYPVPKVGMGLVGAPENVVALVVIDDGL